MNFSIAEMKETFQKLYHTEADLPVYFAPGRVNLIGEHTDYNGGHVFPCALTLGTYGMILPREDRVLRFYSMNFSRAGVMESSLDDLTPSDQAGWTNYPKGVMWTFAKRGCPIPKGADILIYGDIPAGSGLSSSASLEVLTGLMLRETFGFDFTNQDLALIGQYSENNFNGCNCGIMDQFASAMGKKDCAIFLDTNTLNYEYAPVKLEDAKIVITNSNVKHSLVGSAYNDRRRESEEALADLQTVLDIKTLGDLDEETYLANESVIKNEINRKRAHHAVFENQRTLKAVEALRADDIEAFGKLMNESHISLRDDYEVSCPELDILAAEAWKLPYVVGSRMTGGGFGGCTVSIVKADKVDAFKAAITKAYENETGKTPEFYIADAADGARRL